MMFKFFDTRSINRISRKKDSYRIYQIIKGAVITWASTINIDCLRVAWIKAPVNDRAAQRRRSEWTRAYGSVVFTFCEIASRLRRSLKVDSPPKKKKKKKRSACRARAGNNIIPRQFAPRILLSRCVYSRIDRYRVNTCAQSVYAALSNNKKKNYRKIPTGS